MSQIAYLLTWRGRGYISLPLFIIIGGRGYAAPYRSWFWTWKAARVPPRGDTHSTHGTFLLGKTRICCCALVIKSGIKGCFWGVVFGFFWQMWEFSWGVIFLYGLLHMLCGIYDVYMFSLNQEQLCIMGWVVTIGTSVIVSGLTLLLMYCLYCCYKVVKNFSNKNWCLCKLLIYIIVMRVRYTHIKRWDTFTNCECVGGDIV